MKTGKSFNEAILRAHQTSGEDGQQQERLFSMEEQVEEEKSGFTQEHPLNESHKNLMQSWHNLRNLDCDLAERKYHDMFDDADHGEDQQRA